MGNIEYNQFTPTWMINRTSQFDVAKMTGTFGPSLPTRLTTRVTVDSYADDVSQLESKMELAEHERSMAYCP
jgi:hypothetical protein